MDIQMAQDQVLPDRTVVGASSEQERLGKLRKQLEAYPEAAKVCADAQDFITSLTMEIELVREARRERMVTPLMAALIIARGGIGKPLDLEDMAVWAVSAADKLIEQLDREPRF